MAATVGSASASASQSVDSKGVRRGATKSHRLGDRSVTDFVKAKQDSKSSQALLQMRKGAGTATSSLKLSPTMMPNT